jgi:hypothetical protein
MGFEAPAGGAAQPPDLRSFVGVRAPKPPATDAGTAKSEAVGKP